MKNRELVETIIKESYEYEKGWLQLGGDKDSISVNCTDGDHFPHCDFLPSISAFCTFFFIYCQFSKKVVLHIF